MHPKNNFDFLRVLAAALVIYGHGLRILELPTQDVWNIPVATLGVCIFFSISGYLVTDSWLRKRSLSTFAWKRFLRIGPALFVVVTITVFMLGPTFTRLPFNDYFGTDDTWLYLCNAALIYVPNLPGVFESHPLAGVVNGSLWSLPVEVACYVIVPITCLLGIRVRAVVLCFAALLFGMLSPRLFTMPQPIVFLGTDLAAASSVIPYFCVGSAIRAMRPIVPMRIDFALCLVFLLFVVAARFPEQAVAVGWFLIPYIVIATGLACTPGLHNAAFAGDISYGLYLYGYPVERALHDFGYGSKSFYVFVMLSTAIATCFAFASWHLLEKRALRLKALPARRLLALT